MKKVEDRAAGRAKAGVEEAATAFRMELGERLRALLDEYENRQDASAVARVNPDQLTKYLNGDAKPPFEVIARLADDKRYSLNWLALGVGPQSIDGGVDAGFAIIPIWDVEASSGPGRFVGHEEAGGSFPLPLPMLKGAAVNIANLCAVFNRGASNAPDINDGDLMVVDRSVERLIDEAYYLFDDDGLLLVKRIERVLGGGVVLRSRNPDYQARNLTKDEAAALRVFGRVRWRMGAI